MRASKAAGLPPSIPCRGGFSDPGKRAAMSQLDALSSMARWMVGLTLSIDCIVAAPSLDSGCRSICSARPHSILNQGSKYAALTLALMLPDFCGSLERVPPPSIIEITDESPIHVRFCRRQLMHQLGPFVLDRRGISSNRTFGRDHAKQSGRTWPTDHLSLQNAPMAQPLMLRNGLEIDATGTARITRGIEVSFRGSKLRPLPDVSGVEPPGIALVRFATEVSIASRLSVKGGCHMPANDDPMKAWPHWMLRHMLIDNEQSYWELVTSVGGSPPYGGVSYEEAEAVFKLVEDFHGKGMASPSHYKAVSKFLTKHP